MAGELKINAVRHQFAGGLVKWFPLDGDGWRVEASAPGLPTKKWGPQDYGSPLREPTVTRARSFLLALYREHGKGWQTDAADTPL